MLDDEADGCAGVGHNISIIYHLPPKALIVPILLVVGTVVVDNTYQYAVERVLSVLSSELV